MTIIDRIKVLGHDIYLEMSASVPLQCRDSFMQELIMKIEGDIHNNILSGMEPMYYTEEISGEQIDNDVDVVWTIINWREIADSLYKGIQQHTYQDTGTSDLIKAVKMYEDATGK